MKELLLAYVTVTVGQLVAMDFSTRRNRSTSRSTGHWGDLFARPLSVWYTSGKNDR